MTNELKVIQRDGPVFHRGKIAIPVAGSGKDLLGDGRIFFTEYDVVYQPGGAEGRISIGIRPWRGKTREWCFVVQLGITTTSLYSLSSAIEHAHYGSAVSSTPLSSVIDDTLSDPELSTYARLTYRAENLTSTKPFRYVRKWEIFRSWSDFPSEFFYRATVGKRDLPDPSIGSVAILKDMPGFVATYSHVNFINHPFPSFEAATGWLWACSNFASIRRHRRFEDHAHVAANAIVAGMTPNGPEMCERLCGFRYQTDAPYTLHVFQDGWMTERLKFDGCDSLIHYVRFERKQERMLNEWWLGMSDQGRIISCRGGGSGKFGPMSNKKPPGAETVRVPYFKTAASA